jgi:hypothetical protein
MWVIESQVFLVPAMPIALELAGLGLEGRVEKTSLYPQATANRPHSRL